MTRSTDDLIETLGAEAAPVKPLAAPMRRALATLALIGGLGAVGVALMWEPGLARPDGGGGARLALEMLATGATGLLAVVAAFHLAIPGRSRKWMLAPIIPFVAWLALGGWGCLVRNGPTGEEPGADCLFFILGASLLVGIPLIWRLSRASPIDPLPVAAIGGLGAAAIAALLLQFFHPFAATFVDLGIHMIAITIVVGVAALFRRRMLRAA